MQDQDLNYLQAVFDIGEDGIRISFDIEIYNEQLSCISFSHKFDESFCVPFIDNSGDALLDEENVLNFFHDDLEVANEASPGAVAMLKIYDYVLDSTAIKDNFDNLAGNIFFIGEQQKMNTTIQSFPNP